MGRAVEDVVKMGVHDLNCGMSDMDKDCSSDVMAINDSSCCDNEHVFVNLDDTFKVVNPENVVNTKVLIAFSYAFLVSDLTLEEPVQAYADHTPPPLEHDFQAMYQTFIL